MVLNGAQQADSGFSFSGHLPGTFHFGPWLQSLLETQEQHHSTPESTMATNLLASIKGAGLCRQNPFVAATLTSPQWLKPLIGCHLGEGSPHAERDLEQQLLAVQPSWQKGVLYCHLPPCQHQNKKTPPCLPLVEQWPLQQLFVCDTDPNPATAQYSLQFLMANKPDLQINVGLWREAQRHLNRVFYFLQTPRSRPRPYIHLKMALSLDGSWKQVDQGPGIKNNITADRTRSWVHYLRGQYQGVATGGETFRLDSPQLNVRLTPWNERPHFKQPRPIIFTGKQPQSDVFTLANVMTCYLDPTIPVREALENNLDLLYAQGIHSMLVEGGPRLTSLFLEQGIFDELSIFFAPKLLGAPEKILLHQQEYHLPQGQWIPCHGDLWYHYVHLCSQV